MLVGNKSSNSSGASGESVFTGGCQPTARGLLPVEHDAAQLGVVHEWHIRHTNRQPNCSTLCFSHQHSFVVLPAAVTRDAQKGALEGEASWTGLALAVFPTMLGGSVTAAALWTPRQRIKILSPHQKMITDLERRVGDVGERRATTIETRWRWWRLRRRPPPVSVTVATARVSTEATGTAGNPAALISELRMRPGNAPTTFTRIAPHPVDALGHCLGCGVLFELHLAAAVLGQGRRAGKTESGQHLADVGGGR